MEGKADSSPVRVSKAHAFYHRYLPPFALLAAVALGRGQVFRCRVLPPIGAYIAVLGLLAAVVTVLAPEGRWAKSAGLQCFAW